MKAAIYCRVSTSGQDIETQKETLPKFAEAQGSEIYKVYVDDAISGVVDDRPDFKRMLDDMVFGKFNILLVEEHDRITRTENLAERGLILETIKKNDVTVWSPSEGACDLSEFAGEITSTIKFIIAAQERRLIRKRTIKGKKLALKAGNALAFGKRLPYARTFNRETMEWGLDEYKANLIREAAKRYLKGESMRKIANDLKARGSKLGYDSLIQVLKNKSGSKWTIKFKDEYTEFGINLSLMFQEFWMMKPSKL